MSTCLVSVVIHYEIDMRGQVLVRFVLETGDIDRVMVDKEEACIIINMDFVRNLMNIRLSALMFSISNNTNCTSFRRWKFFRSKLITGKIPSYWKSDLLMPSKLPPHFESGTDREALCARNFEKLATCRKEASAIAPATESISPPGLPTTTRAPPAMRLRLSKVAFISARVDAILAS
ncbi:unnamed protein product [Prorocentrum cordatum]|uniref:Uncharacterized protein n=1 Tax=Prorocentrum cordatum TaxID=2364126 RepID=A0ABN9V9P7_9DINO|nr:unnamed protein product [Polarella glacialis]